MKYLYLIFLLAMTFTSNVYAGSFDIRIGKINLPDNFVARPGTPALVRGTTFYSFINNKDIRLATVTLGVVLFDFKKRSPEIAEQSDKSAAVSCLHDTIIAMSKSFPMKAIKPYAQSRIGNHFAMEAVVVGELGSQKLYGDIRCMKYRDFLVTVTITEINESTYLGQLGKKVSDIKLHK